MEELKKVIQELKQQLHREQVVFMKISKEQFIKDTSKQILQYCEENSFCYDNQGVSDFEDMLDEVPYPKEGTDGSAGHDFTVPYDVTIPAGAGLDYCSGNPFVMIYTGMKCKLDSRQELDIHLRSSMGTKNCLFIPNQTGIIDSDYFDNEGNEGHIMIPIGNRGKEDLFLAKGTRIAQGIIRDYYRATNEVDGGSHKTTPKRNGGCGSTGE